MTTLPRAEDGKFTFKSGAGTTGAVKDDTNKAEASPSSVVAAVTSAKVAENKKLFSKPIISESKGLIVKVPDSGDFSDIRMFSVTSETEDLEYKTRLAVLSKMSANEQAEIIARMPMEERCNYIANQELQGKMTENPASYKTSLLLRGISPEMSEKAFQYDNLINKITSSGDTTSNIETRVEDAQLALLNSFTVEQLPKDMRSETKVLIENNTAFFERNKETIANLAQTWQAAGDNSELKAKGYENFFNAYQSQNDGADKMTLIFDKNKGSNSVATTDSKPLYRGENMQLTVNKEHKTFTRGTQKDLILTLSSLPHEMTHLRQHKEVTEATAKQVTAGQTTARGIPISFQTMSVAAYIPPSSGSNAPYLFQPTEMQAAVVQMHAYRQIAKIISPATATEK